MLTIREAITEAQHQLTWASASARLDAALLLGAVLHVNRAYLLAYPDQELSPQQTQHYRALVARRVTGEPIAYILGKRAFYDREFKVNAAVLIPRPETEHLLEHALEYISQHPQSTVVDCGTGSGALAITLAARCPQATVYATDISPKALEVAQANAMTHQVSINWLEGDLLQPLLDQGIKINCIVANLPYIPTQDLKKLDVTRHEPVLALDGGPDGLDLIRRMLWQSMSILLPGGIIMLEIGADQAAAVTQIANEIFPETTIKTYKDYAGLDRVVLIQCALTES